MGSIGREPLPDELWQAIQRMLPPEPPRPKGGRPRVPDRAALAGILHVMRTGIAWELLPRDLGYGSGMTCWRRLREWQRTGVWPKIRRLLLQYPASGDVATSRRRRRRSFKDTPTRERDAERRGAA